MDSGLRCLRTGLLFFQCRFLLASGAFPSFDSFVEQGITYGYVCISLELLEISVILQEQRNLMCLLVWQQNRFISIIFDDTQFVALGEMLNGNDGFGH